MKRTNAPRLCDDDDFCDCAFSLNSIMQLAALHTHSERLL